MVVALVIIHMAWTSLNMVCSAVNFLGKFERETNSYNITNMKIIRTINFLEKDKNDFSILIPKVCRNGEIKQFIAGGNVISFFGAK